MGRTARQRQRKKNNPTINSVNLKHMEDWMRVLGWSPVCHLTPHVFKDTGRGLMCLEPILSKNSIIKIPKKLLITVGLVSRSVIKDLFIKNKLYDAQSVLAVFLLYQRHLGSLSDWKIYIDSLPASYTVPDYCNTMEKKKLPDFLAEELDRRSRNVVNQYRVIVQSISELDEDKNRCNHCGKVFKDIVTFRGFEWAFYTVNTRAVYVDNSKSTNELINIKNWDNLALAPFLDLFNHSYDAEVDVDLIRENGDKEFYEIKTLKPFDKGSQVFINYGPHNSVKLYLEYGFFIPINPLDEVYVNYEDIKLNYPVSDCANEFIVLNELNKNIGFTRQGLNYNAKIIFFILTSKNVKRESWKIKIYQDVEFRDEEIFEINILGGKFVEFKKNILDGQLRKMKLLKNVTESFKIGIALVEEHISILKNCSEFLHNLLNCL